MALVCISGARECEGCGGCHYFSGNEELACKKCGDCISEDEAYADEEYAPLCLSCLAVLHKL